MALHQSKKPIKTETGRWHYKNCNQTQEPDWVNYMLAFEQQIKTISREIQAAIEHWPLETKSGSNSLTFFIFLKWTQVKLVKLNNC